MGFTPDISAFLHFRFWQKVLFLDNESSFPSTTEKPGYWLGVSENVGDALTFKILTADTLQIIHRSVVRPATDLSRPNIQARWPDLDPDHPRILETDSDMGQEVADEPVHSSDESEPPIVAAKRVSKRHSARTRKHKVR